MSLRLGVIGLALMSGGLLALSGCTGAHPTSPSATAARSSSPSAAGDAGLPESALYTSLVDQMWADTASSFPNLTRPKTRVIRYITPEEWTETMADCMADQGFPVDVLPDGGIQPKSVPTSQQESLAVAQFVCFASYPYEDKYSTPLDASQIGHLYDYFVDVAVPCLESFGLTPDDPPSVQVFTETYGKNGWWTPFATLGAINDPDVYNQVSVACPQYPNDLWG